MLLNDVKLFGGGGHVRRINEGGALMVDYSIYIDHFGS